VAGVAFMVAEAAALPAFTAAEAAADSMDLPAFMAEAVASMDLLPTVAQLTSPVMG